MAIHKSLLVMCVSLAFLLIGSKVEASSHHHHHHHHRGNGFPEKLFVFGDSYVDTGNFRKSEATSWRVPYGMTFPGKPAGRFSDGRVFADFVAKSVGLRSPIPYRRRDVKPELQRYGINFACGGTGVFDTLNMMPNMTTQINSLERLVKEGLYSLRDLESSLALVSVAGNDYGTYKSNNGTIQGLPLFIPSLIGQLHVDLQRLRRIGVRKIAVTAIEPLGCLTDNVVSLSYKHCDEILNNASIFHNRLLQRAVDHMNNGSNASTVVLLDLYGAFMSALHGQDQQGRKKFEDPLKPCCIGTSAGAWCGSIDKKGDVKYKVCESPKSFFFWDSVHPSQAGWSTVADYLQSTLHSLSQ